MSVDERSKAEIVSRVLGRIAEDRYFGDSDEHGELIIIRDYEPTFDERENYLEDQLAELEKLRNESVAPDRNFPLGEHWSDSWTRKLLEQYPFGENDREQLLPILKGKSYEQVIDCLYGLLTGNLQEVERLLSAGRETIPKIEHSEISSFLDETYKSEQEFHDRLSSFHARRLSKQFPRIIDRAVGLALVKVDYEVPDKVRRYIEEASKSYLNGQWIACLMVCRSAIEFVVRDRLIFFGYESELNIF